MDLEDDDAEEEEDEDEDEGAVNLEEMEEEAVVVSLAAVEARKDLVWTAAAAGMGAWLCLLPRETWGSALVLLSVTTRLDKNRLGMSVYEGRRCCTTTTMAPKRPSMPVMVATRTARDPPLRAWRRWGWLSCAGGVTTESGMVVSLCGVCGVCVRVLCLSEIVCVREGGVGVSFARCHQSCVYGLAAAVKVWGREASRVACRCGLLHKKKGRHNNGRNTKS